MKRKKTKKVVVAKVKKTAPKKKRMVKKIVVYKPITKEKAPMRRKKKTSYPIAKRTPAKRRRSSRRSNVSLAGITKELMPLGLALAAVFGGSAIMKKIPMISPKVKPFIPLAAGIFLRVTGKKQVIREIGTGLTMLGGIAAVNQFIPAIAMQGDSELMGMVTPSLLGIDDINLLGEPVSVMGDDDLSGDDILEGEEVDYSGTGTL